MGKYFRFDRNREASGDKLITQDFEWLKVDEGGGTKFVSMLQKVYIYMRYLSLSEKRVIY